MNGSSFIPNWALLQSFASVAAHGSLSAAARASKTSQPTLSRHISTLEQALGYRVLRRTAGGIDLTPEGAKLAAQVSKMSEVAAGLGQVSEGTSLKGTVRISASQIVATYILPVILSEIHVEEPEIQIEVVATDETDNLLRREADIALRMYQPTQLDVIAKKVTELELGIYAAHSYLERNDMPKQPKDLMEHDLIGYDRSELIIDGMRKMGYTITRDFFKFRSDDQVVCWQMVLAGFGIGFNQVLIGDADPRVQRIAPEMPIGTIPIWLAAHTGLKTNPRVRCVFDELYARIHKLR
jgi:DNA-binding transcriptional LysR family regulator